MTGVQTCALPIWFLAEGGEKVGYFLMAIRGQPVAGHICFALVGESFLSGDIVSPVGEFLSCFAKKGTKEGDPGGDGPAAARQDSPAMLAA